MFDIVKITARNPALSIFFIIMLILIHAKVVNFPQNLYSESIEMDARIH